MASIHSPVLSFSLADYRQTKVTQFGCSKGKIQRRNESYRRERNRQTEFGGGTLVSENGCTQCNFSRERVWENEPRRSTSYLEGSLGQLCAGKIKSWKLLKGNAKKRLPVASSLEPRIEIAGNRNLQTEIPQTAEDLNRRIIERRLKRKAAKAKAKARANAKAKANGIQVQEEGSSNWRDDVWKGVEEDDSDRSSGKGTTGVQNSENEWKVSDSDVDSQEETDSEENGVEIVTEVPMVDRVYELRKRVQILMARGEEVQITPRDIARLFDFPVDKFQRLAIEAFLKGSSVVVCAPTSSGKTLIAEAAAAAVMAKGERLFYTTPLKALSNQKLHDFRKRFGEENVGLLTGDAAVNRDAPIVVMTTEILRNMLYSSVGSLADNSSMAGVSAVVLDEVHYLSDKSRGTVWEETVIYCPKEVKLVCLSATVANPEELADWIAQVHGPTELVLSSRRPVPLMWHFSAKEALFPLLNEQGTHINRRLLPPSRRPEEFRREEFDSRYGGEGEWGYRSVGGREESQRYRQPQPPRIEETLEQLKSRDMLPAIWFIFSRRGCDTAVDFVRNKQLVTEGEREELEKEVKEFKRVSPEAVRVRAVESLLNGVASHHAGCLPAWKSFVERLYQRGLVKVVFATETLAAGINMPARTTVLATLSKRGDDGHSLLSSNSMLQMAGRAGRRGQDKLGHVVIVQTRFEGAEEACRILFAGSDPLVSQFTASYGMALNLLAGSRKQIRGDSSKEGEEEEERGGEGEKQGESGKETSDDVMGRTMDEAKLLVERSFGNYLGNEVVVEARKKLKRLEEQAAQLEKQKREREEEGFEGGIEPEIWDHYQTFRARLRKEKEELRLLRKVVSMKRIAIVEPELVEYENKKGRLIVIKYQSTRIGEDRELAILYVNRIPRPFFATYDDRDIEDEDDDNSPLINNNESLNLTDFNSSSTSFVKEMVPENPPPLSPPHSPRELSYNVGLGADNRWYVFTSAAVQSVHKPIEFSNLESSLKEKLQLGSREWIPVGISGETSGASGRVWSADGNMNTWKWSSVIPMSGELQGDLIQENEELMDLESRLTEQRTKVSVLRKQMKSTRGYKEHQLLIQNERRFYERVTRAQLRAEKLRDRLNKLQPAGWEQFVQVVNVLEKSRAVDMQSRKLLPLGQGAAAIRGANELWLAVALMDSRLGGFSPSEMAAFCSMLVAEGIKGGTGTQERNIYETSSTVLGFFHSLIRPRIDLEDLQTQEGVSIPCVMDPQFSGLVEAWASGVSWKELTADGRMDEGDTARLLRRTIDLLSQIPHLPIIDPSVGRVAKQAAKLMDRPPISELIG